MHDATDAATGGVQTADVASAGNRGTDVVTDATKTAAAASTAQMVCLCRCISVMETRTKC